MFAILITAALSVVFMSFVEYSAHRWFMHKMPFPKWVYKRFPSLLLTQEDHSVGHHRRFYRVFNNEPDRVGRRFNIYLDKWLALVGLSPIWLGLGFLFGWPIGATFLAVVLGHHFTWNAIHEQMHNPSNHCWFSKLWAFRFLARYHFLHHRYPGKNYNVVFPIFDWILRTGIEPRQADIDEMERLGVG